MMLETELKSARKDRVRLDGWRKYTVQITLHRMRSTQDNFRL
jgi:hypothetical protein